MIKTIKKFFRLLTPQEKRKIKIISFLMLIAAIFETLSIGLILPVINLLIKPESLNDNTIMLNIYQFFCFESISTFGIFLSACLIILFTLKVIYLFFNKKYQLKVIFSIEVRLMKDMLSKYAEKDYEFFLLTNSAEILRVIYTDVARVITKLVIPLIQLITEFTIFIFLMIYLFTVNWVISLVVVITFSIFALIYLFLISRGVRKAGQIRLEKSGNIIKWISQTINSIKEIKIFGQKNYFTQNLEKQSIEFAKANIIHKIYVYLPQLLVEYILAIILLSGILIVLARISNIIDLFPIIIVFAMASLRIMPAINRSLGYLTQMKGQIPFVKVVYENYYESSIVKKDTCSQVKNNNIGEFESLELKNITFSYQKSDKSVFNKLNFKIDKNEIVGIIGESGAGKTTLIYLIMGLLNPSLGNVRVNSIEIDDNNRKHWISKIGFIPQNIYLLDDTISSNVAFGRDEIDEEKVRQCLEIANLKEFVDSLPNGVNCEIGENGANVSGGQKQRIGIARAFYNNPSVIIMDEGTSALDANTEKNIMELIYQLKGDKTLIIIAHRLSTLKYCNKIFDVNKLRFLTEEEMYRLRN